MHEVIFTLGAQIDLQELYMNFEDRASGRGDLFLAAVNRSISLLNRFPKLGPRHFRTARRLVFFRGNFGIFYVIEGKRILVHIVADLRGSPSVLAFRLESIPSPSDDLD